ncbi:MAG: shikimate kinase AroL [Phycisphaerales bacterium]
MSEALPSTYLVLMGLRACGKSTLARAIGERLGVPARDLDPMVLERLGAATVREAWEAGGEPAFRRAETEALRTALRMESPSVLALGGGTPTAPGAAEVLRDAVRDGAITLVYLRLSPEALRERMSADDPDRPSLTGGDALEEITRVFEARDPLYRELAEHEYAPECSVDRDVSKLIALWRAS